MYIYIFNDYVSGASFAEINHAPFRLKHKYVSYFF